MRRFSSGLMACLFFLSSNTLKVWSQTSTLRINEFMAINQTTLVDEDGDYSDWIEIYNPTSAPVNLQGWALTDDMRIPFKWVFSDLTLEAGDYLILFASAPGKAEAFPEVNCTRISILMELFSCSFIIIIESGHKSSSKSAKRRQ